MKYWDNLSTAAKIWAAVAVAIVATGGAFTVVSSAAEKVEPYFYAHRGYVRWYVLAQEEPRDLVVKQIYDFQRADWIERKEKELDGLITDIRDGEVRLLEMKDATAKSLQAQILGDKRRSRDKLADEIKKIRDAKQP